MGSSRSVLGFGARAALALAGLAALAPDPGAAQSWQVEYDPGLGTLPSAQGFIHIVSDPAPADGLNEGNYLVALGVLTQGNTGGPSQDNGNQQSYRVTLPPSRIEDSVVVVDLRLKILASTQSTTAAGFSFSFIEDQRETVGVFVGSSSVFLFTGNGTAHQEVPFDTTADFNDYRLRIDRWRAELEINGVEVTHRERDPDLWKSGTGVANVASFGDGSVLQRSSSQLEVFRVARFNPPTAEVHDYQVVTQTSPLNSTGSKTVTVACPTGMRPLGAGANVFDGSGENGIANVGLSESRPIGGPPATSWTVTAREVVSTSTSWRLEVEALCGELSDYQVVTNSNALSTDRAQAEHADCGERRSVVGGGARVLGAALNQAITTGFVPPLSITPTPAWRVGVNDFGAGATSSAAWGIEVYAICTRAIDVEIVEASSGQDGTSPKQATVNCPTGKVPIHGSASAPNSPIADQSSATRVSAPKYAVPGEPPVGWLVEAQSQATLWTATARATCVPIADPTVSKNGLRGRWNGEFGAFDSWHARHGTLENGVGFAPGIAGQAFELTAANQQWVRVPSTLLSDEGAPWLYPERSFTVDAWFATETLSSDPFTAIVNLYEFGGTDPVGNCSTWQLTLTEEGFPQGTVRPAQQGCASASLTGDTPLDDGRFHHVAFSRDSDTRLARLYVDGQLEGQTTLTLESTDGPLFPASTPDPIAIGIWRSTLSTNLIRAFEGRIDDVKFYDRALSLDEIQNIAGCHLPMLPRILNLDAALFGNRPGGDHALCVFLEAGTYRLTLLSPAQTGAARFTAWSPAPDLSWGTQFTVDPELDAGFAFGLPVGASTMQGAFDATSDRDTQFTLTADQRVHFSIQDLGSLDNRGGVSVRLEAPEPALGLLLAAGSGLLGAFGRRRADRRAT